MLLEHFKLVRDWLAGVEHLLVEPAVQVAHEKPVRAAYAVIYGGGPDDLDDERLTSPQLLDSDAVYRYPVRSIGPDPVGALAVSAKVQARMINAQLELTGRSLDPIRLFASGRLREDPAIDPPLCFIDDIFELVSRRA